MTHDLLEILSRQFFIDTQCVRNDDQHSSISINKISVSDASRTTESIRIYATYIKKYTKNQFIVCAC